MTLIAAALLGIVQGLTEFLPVSSTAHLLIGARLIGFDDPGGVFTVTIQLGSILAVMWLYRDKILRVIVGLPSDPEARHFALMVFVAFLPAVVAGALFAGYVKRVLYTTPAVIAWSFIVGGIVMLIVERYRPEPVVRNADHTSLARALGDWRLPGAGDDSRRVAIRRHHRRRHAAAARSSGRGRVLVFSGDANDDGGVRARHARGPAQPRTGPGRGDRGRVRPGVHRGAAGRQAVPWRRPARRVRAVRLVQDCRRGAHADCAGRSARCRAARCSGCGAPSLPGSSSRCRS